ncbi:dead-box atp-dependent rna helicase 51-like protein [Lasius niger]|uniref:Dead-box atp-dependent rna helicase 51-like protein n=1 Tax=Lasius niger TaxID=67767 RepID=A0A0J7L339_LASNI|nr:dead-box atp-dependent rna helicase 51-like protein [Lasius niger]
MRKQGNKERANRYWRNAEENKCGLCGQKVETLEHLIKECNELEKEEEITKWKITQGQEEGSSWMRKIIRKRKEKENQLKSEKI